MITLILPKWQGVNVPVLELAFSASLLLTERAPASTSQSIAASSSSRCPARKAAEAAAARVAAAGTGR